jgi:mRNA-degrading endonuclease toxin of MazEF toxin-antitoxin module
MPNKRHPRGSVVWVEWADPNGYSKPRPVLIIQDDSVQGAHASYICCYITSQIRQDTLGQFRIPVLAASPDGKAMKIDKDSTICVDTIGTYEPLHGTVIGSYPQMAKVDAMLRKLLRLP